MSASLGLDAEWERLDGLGLSEDVVHTMSTLHHSSLHIQMDSFSVLACREGDGPLLISPDLQFIFSPAADGQETGK